MYKEFLKKCRVLPAPIRIQLILDDDTNSAGREISTPWTAWEFQGGIVRICEQRNILINNSSVIYLEGQIVKLGWNRTSIPTTSLAYIEGYILATCTCILDPHVVQFGELQGKIMHSCQHLKISISNKTLWNFKAFDLHTFCNNFRSVYWLNSVYVCPWIPKEQ